MELLIDQSGVPVLRSSHLRGYLHVADEERHFSEIALIRHADLVEVWYRLLTLYDIAAATTHHEPKQIEGTVDQQLRLQLMAVGAGTAKHIFDLTLAGHYTQARALIRHLFESLICIWFVEVKPEAAIKWYVADDGTLPQPPKATRMYAALRKANGGSMRQLVDKVVNTISVMNYGAHPSPQTAQQTVTSRGAAVKTGGNYLPDQCVDTLHHGASRLRLLVAGWPKLLQQSPDWEPELAQIIKRHREVMEQYRQHESGN